MHTGLEVLEHSSLFFGYSGKELSGAGRLKGNIACMVGACLDLLLSLKMVLNHMVKHYTLQLENGILGNKILM